MMRGRGIASVIALGACMLSMHASHGASNDYYYSDCTQSSLAPDYYEDSLSWSNDVSTVAYAEEAEPQREPEPAPLPAGDGPIAFGGVNWHGWRTGFAVEGDKLMSLPHAEPGFDYGPGGHGRGPLLVSNVGSDEWRDYRVEFDFCMTGVDASFNPYGLPLSYRGGVIYFHLVTAKQSWNDRGLSTYSLSFNKKGEWQLSAGYNRHSGFQSGWGNLQGDTHSLTNGTGLHLDPVAGNRFRIEVEGTRIRVWVDGEALVDIEHEDMGVAVDGTTLDHGGVGFHWYHDSMGWIRSFSAERL